MTPQQLDTLRRSMDLRLSRMGRFWLAHSEVTHPRTIAALRAGLDITPEGEHVVYLGETWCYLHVDDTPLQVLSIDTDARKMKLNDGRTLAVSPSHIREDGDGTLVCEVPAQRSGRALRARLTNRATMQWADAWLPT